jgi:hypothetical protein
MSGLPMTSHLVGLAATVLAADGRRSAPVTDWGARILLTLLVLAVLTGVYWLMWRGWRNRASRQSGLPVPVSTPPKDARFDAVRPAAAGAAADEDGLIEGVYASTTAAGDWLDRIAAHGLGVRSHARIGVGPAGVFLARDAAPDLFIPAADLLAAAPAPGIAGKVTGGEGLVLVTWSLGGTRLDTGFHPRARKDREPLITAINELLDSSEREARSEA